MLRRSFRHRLAVPRVLTLSLSLALASCTPEASTATDGGAPAAQKVSIIEVGAATTPRTVDLPGRLTPTRIAEVRAQVSGIVQERSFEEGSFVRKGDVLFLIDTAIYTAELDAKQAALDRALAVREQAMRQSERTEALLERQATSTAQHEIATATYKQAEADVASARAQLARAKINLDYATVRAPIDGRIGRALVTEGALVGQNEPTHLATIRQIDPIFADFVQVAHDPTSLANGAVSEVRLLAPNGAVLGAPGHFLFSDASVDPGTGQVSLRASFPNPNGTLLPGSYVRVRVTQGMNPDAVIIPAQAIQRSSAGEALTYVVEDGKTVALRPVLTGPLTDQGWIVEKGLRPGDHVVVEGFQKIQPGTSVNPVPWSGPAAIDPAGRK